MKINLYVIFLFLLSLSPGFAQTNSWTVAAPLNTARVSHGATTLPDGTVLVTGGFATTGTAYSTTEAYNPAGNSWTAGTPLPVPRGAHATTQLADGKVLVAGGTARSLDAAFKSTFIFDPVSNSWTAGASMATARNQATATLLPDGKVLVTGGSPTGVYFSEMNSTEIYNPATDSWSAAKPMNTRRGNHAATLLPDGKVLVTGGADNSSSSYWSSAELYDPVSNSWTAAASMPGPRYAHKSVLLTNGKVLVIGGYTGTEILNTCALYNPVTNAWSGAPGLPFPRNVHTATVLPSGNVLVTGGSSTLLYQDETKTTFLFNVAPSLTNVQVIPPAVCGQPVTLTATTSYSLGAYSYTITDGSMPAVSGTATGTAFSKSFIPGGSGPKNYTLTIETTYARVSAVAPTVQIPPAVISLSTSNSGTLTCATTSLTLAAMATGGSNFTYAFAGPGLSTTSVSNSAVISQAGTFTVQAGSQEGCVSLTTISVSGSTTVVGPVAVITSGCAPNINLTASAAGATDFTLLSGGNTNSSGVFAVTSAGVYTITAGNGLAGCQSRTVVDVSQAINILIGSLTVSGPASCTAPARLTAPVTGSRFVFTGPGGYVFSNVYRNVGNYTAFAGGLKAGGTYTLTVYGREGCPATSSSIVVPGPDSCP